MSSFAILQTCFHFAIRSKFQTRVSCLCYVSPIETSQGGVKALSNWTRVHSVASAPAAEAPGSPAHFTHLPDELEVQVDVVACKLICVCVCVCVSQKITELRNNEHKPMGRDLSMKPDLSIDRPVAL